MNDTKNLAAVLALLEMINGLSVLVEEAPQESTVIDGFVLVELTDGNMVRDEGVRQFNALVTPQMREMIADRGDVVFSMRDAETDVSVLSLSVNGDGIVRHVVGKHNAAPSADQLDVLQQLLAAQGLELQYNPFTMY